MIKEFIKDKRIIAIAAALAILLILVLISVFQEDHEPIGEVETEALETEPIIQIEKEEVEAEEEPKPTIEEIKEEHSEEYVEKVEYISQHETKDYRLEIYEEVNDLNYMIKVISQKILSGEFEEGEASFLDMLNYDLNVVIGIEEKLEREHESELKITEDDLERSSQLNQEFNLIQNPVLYISSFMKLREKDQMLLVHNWNSEFLYDKGMIVNEQIEIDSSSDLFKFTSRKSNTAYTYTVFRYRDYPDMQYGVFMIHREIRPFEFESYIEQIYKVDENFVPIEETFNPMYLQAKNIDEKYISIMKPKY